MEGKPLRRGSWLFVGQSQCQKGVKGWGRGGKRLTAYFQMTIISAEISSPLAGGAKAFN